MNLITEDSLFRTQFTSEVSWECSPLNEPDHRGLLVARSVPHTVVTGGAAGDVPGAPLPHGSALRDSPLPAPPEAGEARAPVGGGGDALKGAAEVPRQPGQLPRPPVGDAVPGELDQHHHQQAELYDDEPEHAGPASAAHLLVVQVEEGAVALHTLHLLCVQDDAAELF